MPAEARCTPTSNSSSSQKAVNSARVLSGALAGFLEISMFHPVDTAAKRLICHQGSCRQAQTETVVMQSRIPLQSSLTGGVFRPPRFEGLRARPVATLAAPLQPGRVLSMEPLHAFRQSAAIALGAASHGGTTRDVINSMYKGLRFAYLYKTMQRGFQYSVQPYLATWFSMRYRTSFEKVFTPKFAQPVEHAVAGCIMGCSEIMFLPLDSLKVKSQTGSRLSFGGMSMSWTSTAAHLYRAAGWTAARNGLGAFTLFGGAALTKERVMGIREYRQATPLQHLASSSVASVLCIFVSAPLDVIKIRVQRQEIGSVQGGFKIARDLIRHEGRSALFKGVVPKCGVAAPKIMFAYTFSHWLYQKLSSA